MSNNLRILFLEDSLYDAELSIAALEKAGYTCQWERIETRAEFLARLDPSAPDYDVILADYNLPTFDGLTALKLFLERDLDIPFILVSGALGEEIAIESLKTGATDYVLKDRLSRLAPVVKRALREKEEQQQRKQAEAEIRRKNRELALFNRIITATVSDLPLEETLRIVCRELGQIFDVDRIAASLLNETKSEATVVAEYRANRDHPPALNQTIPIKGSPSFRRLLAQKTPLIMQNAPTDPRLNAVSDRMGQSNVMSLLLLPLLVEDELIGALTLSSTGQRKFPASEVNLAWSAMDQVSASLARARLEQSRRRLTMAIEQATDSVIITNTEGTILYVNPAFEDITGYSRAEAIGQNPRVLKSGKQDDAHYKELWDTISAGKVWRGRFINKKKDGSFFTEDAAITPIRDKHGEIVNYIATKRDVTQELQLEEQYRQAQKMEAIGLLTSGIAHDFNNMLTVIMGYSGVLLSDYAPDDPHREDIEQIKLAAERAAALTRQLLAFSRQQTLRPQILNLNQVIGNLEKMLRRMIGEDIILLVKLLPEPGQIEADPGQIEQILMNLAVNARDAMPDGGRLIVETSNRIVDAAQAARHINLPPGDYIVLSITDTGCGMDENTRTHIFEPFFTTKGVGRGTGLGLSTVYGIVQQNKGHIEVDSVLNQGTTFTIYFPQASPTTAPVLPRKTAPTSATGKETILLVEDENGVRLITARMLKKLGYAVLEANSAETALELCRQRNEKIDLLITDIVMPDMGGPDLAKKLARSNPGLKTLFISGYTGEMLNKYDISLSSVIFLEKPFTVKTLSRKAREALESRL